MDGSGGWAPRPWFVTQRFDDADDLARSLTSAGVTYVPLQPGPYDSRLTVIGWRGMTLQRATDRAHVVRGAIDHDAVALLFPLHLTATPTINGWQTDGTDGAFLGPGSDLHGLCPGDVDWVSLVMPAESAESLVALAGLRGQADRPGTMLRAPPEVILPLRRAALLATDAVTSLPTALAAPEVAEALSAGLTEQILTAFAAAEASPVPRATREAVRLVDRAEALLHAHPDRPSMTADLCAALGVSPRSLHKAFVAVTGISPQAYLRRRRLMMVRSALKDGGGDAGLVKSVALAHGFWHLGHFARSYREQFGEPPSETLAAARVGRYRRAVRPGPRHE